MNNKKLIYTITVIIIFAGVLFTGIITSYLIKKPIGMPLIIETEDVLPTLEIIKIPTQSRPTEMIIFVPTATTHSQTNPDPTKQSTLSSQSYTISPDQTVTPKATTHISDTALCEQNEQMIVIFAAINTSNANQIAQPSFIRLGLFDFENNRIIFFELPEEKFVSGQLAERLNLENTTIQEVFNYVIHNASGTEIDNIKVAANYLAQSIYDIYRIAPQHYAVFETSNILESMNPNNEFLLHDELFTSNEMIELIEISENPSDEQNAAIMSMRKFVRASNLQSILSNLLLLAETKLITDLSGNYLSNLICLFKNVNENDIQFINEHQIEIFIDQLR